MSRYEYENEKYMVAVGVDITPAGHTSFMQVWNQPHDDRDGAALIIDGFGVNYQARDRNADLGDRLPDDIELLLEEITERYEIAKEQNNRYPNIDHETISEICGLLGFEDIDVHGILD